MTMRVALPLALLIATPAIARTEAIALDDGWQVRIDPAYAAAARCSRWC